MAQKHADWKAHFEQAARNYDKQGGGLTRMISRHILKELLVAPFTHQSVVLDNAAGPGITATEMLYTIPKEFLPQNIYATDLSPAMVAEIDKRGHPEIKAQVMDAQNLTFEDGMFSHTFGLFFIFSVPDPVKVVQEVYRTLQPGGTAYISTWKSLAWIGKANKALHKVKPDAPEYTGPLAMEWFTADKLRDVLVAGGFEESQVKTVLFESRVDPVYWESSLGFARSPAIFGQVTRGLHDDERKQYDSVLEEEMMDGLRKGIPVEAPCWIGIATKGQ